ncbi:YegS/Rv2252/BmrU family lipid kinase [Catellatospora sichuanensis]|uniref:YegS/Rv2252/BmrU family lipid kinase n=1 Tax=Catellatospora sichuanensis TaxID=1969805 RepID=UPI001182C422|nr:YegS/Rv2252/BmrU family lipid kinase [Catellatospora sichuanensis]
MSELSDEIVVLRNPGAGRGRHRGSLPGVLERLGAAGRPVRVLDAPTAAEAEQACRDAVAAGAGALVAMGGDGTVHLVQQAVAGTSVPLGVIPAGTGNDFATSAGLPADLYAAADAIAAALREGRTRALDLARITCLDGTVRWYGAVLAAGFDAIVNERGNRMRWPRGPIRYDLAVLLELVRLRPRRYTVTVDGQTSVLDAVLLAVGNTAAYGGGMRICPDADATDGLLDMVWAEPVSRATLIRIKPRVYQGTHITHPKVRSLRAREITLAAEGIVCYADGERIGPLPVTVTAVPQAVHLLS